MRTRLGFSKGGANAAPESSPARGARTLPGHGPSAPHLEASAPATSVHSPPTPPPRPTGRRTGPSGKSGFPARAGFWGRRNSEGELVPLTEPILGPVSGTSRRWGTLQAAGVLFASAVLSFLAVIGMMHVWTQLERSRQTPPSAHHPG